MVSLYPPLSALLPELCVCVYAHTCITKSYLKLCTVFIVMYMHCCLHRRYQWARWASLPLCMCVFHVELKVLWPYVNTSLGKWKDDHISAECKKFKVNDLKTLKIENEIAFLEVQRYYTVISNEQGLTLIKTKNETAYPCSLSIMQWFMLDLTPSDLSSDALNAFEGPSVMELKFILSNIESQNSAHEFAVQ